MSKALAVAGLLLAFSSASYAVYTETEILTGWSPKAGGGFSRNIFNPAMQSTSRALTLSGGGVQAATTATLAGPAGPLSVVARGVMTRAAIGSAVGRCLIMANPLCAAGTAAYVAYDYFRVRPAQGELEWDPGQPLSQQQIYTASSGAKGGSNVGAYSAHVEQKKAEQIAAFGPQCPGGVTNITVGSAACDSSSSSYCTGLSVKFECRNSSGNLQSSGTNPVNTNVTKTVQQACEFPQSPGYDGKCSSNTRQRVTPAFAADLFDKTPTPGDLPSIADAGIKGGQGVEATPGATTGPASQTGSPTTVTSTDPQGAVTSTTTTPTYNYDYSTGDVTYNRSETVRTCVGANSCSSVVTTTPPVQDAQDPEDPCVKNPDSIGCAKFGKPEGGEVSRSSKTVSFSGGGFADGGSCPADASFSAMGHSYAMSWSPICNAASVYIRPVILVLAAAAAAFIFIGGLRS